MSPWGFECTGPDVFVAMWALNLQETNEQKINSQQAESKECILRLFVAVLSTNTPLPAVLKRATTIKRRDAGHRGQPGEEQYSDISSVGE